MAVSQDIIGTFHLSSKTESAGTVITTLVPPKLRGITRITELIYTSSTTAHTLTVMRPIARTTLASAALAAASTLTLSAVNTGYDSAGAAENLAANDYIAWELDSGLFDYDIIASINTTTKVVTLTGTSVSAAAAGSKVWLFHEVGRTLDHVILKPQVALATYYTSYTTYFRNEIAGVVSSGLEKSVDPYNYANTGIARYAPLLLHSTNATAAGTIVAVNGYYARK